MKNIVLIGMMGSGKTTIGKTLSQKLNKEFIDMDELIVTQNNMSISDMFKISEEFFRDKETQCTLSIENVRNCVISTGGGIIKRKENIDLLKKNGIIIYLNRPLDNIVADIELSSRPLIQDDIQKVYDIYSERHDQYLAVSDYSVLNDSSIEEVCLKIIEICQ